MAYFYMYLGCTRSRDSASAPFRSGGARPTTPSQSYGSSPPATCRNVVAIFAPAAVDQAELLARSVINYGGFFGAVFSKRPPPGDEAAPAPLDQRPGTVYVLTRVSTGATVAALPAHRGKWAKAQRSLLDELLATAETPVSPTGRVVADDQPTDATRSRLDRFKVPPRRESPARRVAGHGRGTPGSRGSHPAARPAAGRS
jgi:hypothetical protein